MPAGTEATIPLPLRWVAAGTVRGLGLAAFAQDRPWRLSVTEELELRIEARLGAP